MKYLPVAVVAVLPQKRLRNLGAEVESIVSVVLGYFAEAMGPIEKFRWSSFHLIDSAKRKCVYKFMSNFEN